MEDLQSNRLDSNFTMEKEMKYLFSLAVLCTCFNVGTAVFNILFARVIEKPVIKETILYRDCEVVNAIAFEGRSYITGCKIYGQPYTLFKDKNK